MNAYGQRWAPWGWAAVFSLTLWVLLGWLVFQVAVGCAPLGVKYTVEAHKGARPGDPADAPVPPPASIPECKDSASLMCCCDMSTKGIISCRCPHPGGVVP
jgi:hypothetical protein